MIIARITSGLGNQLFQYALGRSLSLRRGQPLYVDLSYYRQAYATDTLRAFRLDAFRAPYTVLNTSPYRYVAKATRLLPNRTLKPVFQFVRERQFHFDADVLNARARFLTLSGFWQSERYFADCADVLRRELTFKQALSPSGQSVAQIIEAAQTPVSVHIRRGDYVSHSEFSRTFGFVGLEYYRAAIARVTAGVPNPTLFVFSDDPVWVRQHLTPAVPHVFVSSAGPDADLDDLHLMSRCHHHIIANSSFSWWGAWLNPRPDKLVIAPDRWFADKPDCDTSDLIPAGWHRL